MNHKAIYALYSNVVSVDDTAGAMDANGNSVEVDLDAVNAWVDPEQYKIDRATAYGRSSASLTLMEIAA